MQFKISKSYYEATARARLAAILDPDSFVEIIPPNRKQTSPHLELFNVPVAFDDGVVIGEGRLDGQPVSILAQEGKFMGGALGEVHSAKITGLLKRSLVRKPAAVICLWDSGGVRLQEANAGEIGVAEIIRAIFDLRAAAIPVLGVVGGTCGCFGGAGIISACCDVRLCSEEGRIGVSGPKVIESTLGVDAFDSRDNALVWRTTGGKNRYLFGFVNTLVENSLAAFRLALVQAMTSVTRLDLPQLEHQQTLLKQRLQDYAGATDALQIWSKMGFAQPAAIPDLSCQELNAQLQQLGGR